ncbi:MAG: hypothetical protein LKF69_01570 [Bacilli bacterium]|jgi:translation elongation factor EF-Tu-like GTPase|nr:hypothetical protein [Bacilli bacterium]MCH4235476.1 hypothetical protein [Bacilli bacterium]
MNNKFKARIKWLSKEEGGRQFLPSFDKYGAVIKVKKPSAPIEKIFWSLIIENQEQIGAFETISDVFYLTDDAPDNLRKDVEFELYEGNKLVANGIILYANRTTKQ